MKQLRWFPLLALPLLLSSCEDDTTDTSQCGDVAPPPAGYKVLLSIDTVRDAQRQLQFVLRARDNQTYNCGNYALQTILYARGNQLEFSVCGAQQNGATCTTPPGPAITRTTISGFLGANFPLQINIRGQRSTGTLNLRDIPYQIFLNDTTYVAARR
ncbi:hypothetical protein EJV47_17865 [Hymenobacter gummosus]|uniref:Lipoprotein n=1 Tax=Hymenobacter gummosus TaxID=1776032 RepID=A0A3S0JCI3_9BACT|nr:hypothetical protein [Hymenobacter gummosus]RTQ47788.1 hypothetical protein EJV47_17865 [Hymenobacter gummosus]